MYENHKILQKFSRIFIEISRSFVNKYTKQWQDNLFTIRNQFKLLVLSINDYFAEYFYMFVNKYTKQWQDNLFTIRNQFKLLVLSINDYFAEYF